MRSLKIVSLSLLFFIQTNGVSQSLFNGSFFLGGLNWGCNPETGSEIFYIGNLSLNGVAEVDATAGLCQTITSLVPGNMYSISFDASRRTGVCPSPAVTNIDLRVVGALSVTVTRTNTVFGWSTSAFLFTATSNTHHVIFSAGSGFAGSNCGMLVDNIVVAAAALPVELIGFAGEIKNNQVRLSWSTATEKNNRHFEIEKSENGIDFKSVKHISSNAKNGNSASRLNYETIDPEPFNGMSYYRLKQVDYDGMQSFSPLVAVNYEKEQANFSVYPNPGHEKFTISFPDLKNKQEVSLHIYNQWGGLHYSSVFNADNNSVFNVNPDIPLEPGCYNFCISINGSKVYKKVLVQ